jgi:hypothetical protein
MLQDLADFGYPPEEIEKARADLRTMPVAPTAFDVHPDNVFAVRLFQALQSQWHWVSLSTWSTAEIRAMGLKYEVLELTARLEGLGEIATDDFRRIRFMEAEAMHAWSEARP